MTKTILRMALAGAALTAVAAPANAALQLTFPSGATSGTFGDSSIGPGTYSQSATFTIGRGGQGTFSITATSAFFDITSVLLGTTPFQTVFDGPLFDYRTLVTNLAAGTYKLTVNGTVPANAGATGSYGGQINFVPTAVPEPAAWALMIGGFGLVGGMMRRRVTKVGYTVA